MPKRLKSQLNHKLKAWERAYIACAIDTEGTVYLDPRTTDGVHVHYLADIIIANTDERFMAKIQEILGFGNIHEHHYAPEKHYKTVYTIHITRKNTIKDLLEQISPYLVIKKKIAKEMLKVVS